MSTFSAYTPVGAKRYRERFGLSFAEFAVGQKFRHRPALTLSQQDSRDECLDTLNQQMLHFDEQFARHTEWKKCLMDSTLTTKVVMGMTWKTFARRTGLVGFDEIALTKPLFGGDTLQAESEILDKTAVPGDEQAGRLKVRTTGINQRGEVVATLVYDLLVSRADDASSAVAAEARHGSHVEVGPGVWLERMGLFFEDIVVGETYEHRPGKSFTAQESTEHTLRALDQTPALTDWHFHEKAVGGPLTINPLHVLAVMTGMMTKTFSKIVANLAWKNVRFHAPVRAGETLYAESTVLEKRESKSRPGQGIVTVRTEGRTHDGRLVCSFERAILIYGRGQGPYEAADY